VAQKGKVIILKEEGRRKKEEGIRKFGNEQCTGCKDGASHFCKKAVF
jgi:hypothetical protein